MAQESSPLKKKTSWLRRSLLWGARQKFLWPLVLAGGLFLLEKQYPDWLLSEKQKTIKNQKAYNKNHMNDSTYVLGHDYKELTPQQKCINKINIIIQTSSYHGKELLDYLSERYLPTSIDQTIKNLGAMTGRINMACYAKLNIGPDDYHSDTIRGSFLSTAIEEYLHAYDHYQSDFMLFKESDDRYFHPLERLKLIYLREASAKARRAMIMYEIKENHPEGERLWREYQGYKANEYTANSYERLYKAYADLPEEEQKLKTLASCFLDILKNNHSFRKAYSKYYEASNDPLKVKFVEQQFLIRSGTIPGMPGVNFLAAIPDLEKGIHFYWDDGVLKNKKVINYPMDTVEIGDKHWRAVQEDFYNNAHAVIDPRKFELFTQAKFAENDTTYIVYRNYPDEATEDSTHTLSDFEEAMAAVLSPALGSPNIISYWYTPGLTDIKEQDKNRKNLILDYLNTAENFEDFIDVDRAYYLRSDDGHWPRILVP